MTDLCQGSAMQPITRDFHYVPHATLKRWSEDGIHVWAYRILVSHPDVPEWSRHRISVKRVRTHRDRSTPHPMGAPGAIAGVRFCLSKRCMRRCYRAPAQLAQFGPPILRASAAPWAVPNTAMRLDVRAEEGAG
jgi:hypothetical protein